MFIHNRLLNQEVHTAEHIPWIRNGIICPPQQVFTLQPVLLDVSWYFTLNWWALINNILYVFLGTAQ